MSDLWVYHPAHGFSNTTAVSVSWLTTDDKTRFISDKVTDAYKLTTESGGTVYEQFGTTIIGGTVTDVGSAVNRTISGLDHLEGETITVFSEGDIVTVAVVSSGSITVPIDIYNYTLGLPYTLSIKTSRLEVPAASTNQTRIKRINETVIRHIRTQGGQAGQEYGGAAYLSNLNAVFSNRSADSTIATDGGFSSDSYTVIESSDPSPMTVLAAITGYTVEEVR